MPVDVQLIKLIDRRGSSTHQARIPRLGSAAELGSRITPSVFVLKNYQINVSVQISHNLPSNVDTNTQESWGLDHGDEKQDILTPSRIVM